MHRDVVATTRELARLQLFYNFFLSSYLLIGFLPFSLFYSILLSNFLFAKLHFHSEMIRQKKKRENKNYPPLMTMEQLRILHSSTKKQSLKNSQPANIVSLSFGIVCV